MNPSASRSPGRLTQLDALRGLAALIVVLHHVYLSVPADRALRRFVDDLLPLDILSLGRPAVILFFTLSGFVLTTALAGRDASWGVYAVRRGMRLLPPYWAALAVAYLLYRLLPERHAPGLSPWFDAQWGGPIPSEEVATALPLLVGPGRYPIDHVVWSLVHEFRLSLLLPLLIAAVGRFGVAGCLAIASGIAIAAEAVIALHPAAYPSGYHGYLFDVPGPIPSLVVTARYVPCFALGCVLALRSAAVRAWAAARPARIGLALLVGIAALSQPVEGPMMLGAALVVGAVAVSEPIARSLERPVLRWLGRVSFSLYLVHLPVMLALVPLLQGRIPVPLGLSLTIPASLAAADLFYRLVERPSIDLARRVTAGLPAAVAGASAAIRRATPPMRG